MSINNCWDIMKCSPSTMGSCPAFKRNKGKECWKVTGTQCAQGKLSKVSLEEKIEYCRYCPFYIKFATKF